MVSFSNIMALFSAPLVLRIQYGGVPAWLGCNCLISCRLSAQQTTRKGKCGQKVMLCLAQLYQEHRFTIKVLTVSVLVVLKWQVINDCFRRLSALLL